MALRCATNCGPTLCIIDSTGNDRQEMHVQYTTVCETEPSEITIMKNTMVIVYLYLMTHEYSAHTPVCAPTHLHTHAIKDVGQIELSRTEMA